MKNKVKLLGIAVLVMAVVFAFTACEGPMGLDGKDGIDGKDGADGSDGVDGTDGKDGAAGNDGADGNDGNPGTTPHICDDGYWWIGDFPTGIKAEGGSGGTSDLPPLQVTVPTKTNYACEPFAIAGLVVSVSTNGILIPLPADWFVLLWNDGILADGNTAVTAAAGTKTIYVIDILGRMADFEINVTGHAWDVTTLATCTVASIPGNCTVCGNTDNPETIVAALGHNFGAWGETTAPTCTVAGVDTRTCTRDCGLTGHTETRPVAALGHNFGAWGETTAPTCTVAGVDTRTCTRACGLTGHTETRPITQLGHSFGNNWRITTPATHCTNTHGFGVETDSCLRFDECGETNGTRQTPCLGSGDLTITGGVLSGRTNTSLTLLCIPDSVTSIGFGAFMGNTALTTVVMPDSVTSIEDWVFQGCTNLRTMEFSFSGVFDFLNIFGVHHHDDIPLTTVLINGTSIPFNAFSNMTNLTSVTIGNSVTTIEESAFANNFALSSVVMGNSVTSIGFAAFQGCRNLTSIIIPASVTNIGWGAFAACTSLTTATILATTPPTFGMSPFDVDLVFMDLPSGETVPIIIPGLTIRVPAGSVNAYRTAWSTYASIIQAIP